MSDRKWETLDEVQFASALSESLGESAPEEIIRAVTPWRKAMDRILTGLALNAVTLNFLCLNYILPEIGLVLMLLGFRSLRRENRWFGSCYVISLVRSLYFFPTLILNATIYQGAVYALPAGDYLTAANVGLTLVQFVCLWRGFKSIKAKAGLPAQAGAAAALICWYLVIGALALLGSSGLAAGVIMIAACVLIIRGLYRLSSELDDAGYTVTAAPVRVSDAELVRAIAAILAVGIACGYLFGGSYSMDWTPVGSGESAQTAEVKASLLELGFPEDVLNDLADEDILDCAGALRVVAHAADEPVNGGRETVEYENGAEYHNTAYDVKELRFTDVAVELPGERETWKVFHHFRWTVDPGFVGTESLQLWPAYYSSEGWEACGEATGRVLCTQDGQNCSAAYRYLGSETYTSDSVIWGEQSSAALFAEFSMPKNSEDQRGYVAYTAVAYYDDVQFIINSWINYTHQTGRLQYPVKTAAEYRMSGAWSDTGPFVTVQNALQF